MTEFLKLVTPDDALKIISGRLKTLVTTEIINTAEALGRIVAGDIISPENLPSFNRSTMDGYAVRASDTYGASEGLPAYLRVSGEMPMGKPAPLVVRQGEAVKVHTGGMVAEGADSVVMMENTQIADGTTIEITKPLAPGENTLRIGDDIKEGVRLFLRGHILRPQDIGGLTALGITSVAVYKKPLVGIISAGDEVVPPHVNPTSGQVRDINTYTISNLVRQYGGIPVSYGLLKDDEITLHKVAESSIKQAEILVISSGSSVSTRDITARVIASLGEPGVLVHGISLRPGKPTIIAFIGDKPVFGCFRAICPANDVQGWRVYANSTATGGLCPANT